MRALRPPAGYAVPGKKRGWASGMADFSSERDVKYVCGRSVWHEQYLDGIYDARALNDSSHICHINNHTTRPGHPLMYHMTHPTYHSPNKR